jgi:hypothetical protein
MYRQAADVATGGYVKDDDMTLSELFERFMAQKRSTGLEQTTLARYQDLFDCHLTAAFGKIKVKELKQSHLVRQYLHWKEKGSSERPISARTIRPRVRPFATLSATRYEWSTSLETSLRSLAATTCRSLSNQTESTQPGRAAEAAG